MYLGVLEDLASVYLGYSVDPAASEPPETSMLLSKGRKSCLPLSESPLR